MCCNGLGVSTHFWKYLADRFSPERAVVLWDYRGHGRSAEPARDQRIDIPRMAWDLGFVCDALELDRPVLAGHSMGSQVILERYRQAPDRVGGLISVLGAAGHPLDTFAELDASRLVFDLVIAASEAAPRAFDLFARTLVALPIAYDFARRANLVDGSRLSRHDLRQYLHHLTDIGFGRFFAVAKALGEHTAVDVLPRIDVPALVIAAEFDGFTPPALARSMHEAIKDSWFLYLEGASHAGIVEQPERINAEIARFLTEAVEARRPSPG